MHDISGQQDVLNTLFFSSTLLVTLAFNISSQWGMWGLRTIPAGTTVGTGHQNMLG